MLCIRANCCMTIAALFGAGVGWLEQEIGVHEEIMGRKCLGKQIGSTFCPRSVPFLYLLNLHNRVFLLRARARSGIATFGPKCKTLCFTEQKRADGKK